MSIALDLKRAALQFGQRIALVDLDTPGGRKDFTYESLWRRVLLVAASLRTNGLQAGDRVGLLVTNSHEYVEIFFGCAAAGMVVVPMNTRLLEDEQAHFLRDSGARLLVVEGRLLRKWPSLLGIAEFGCIVTRAGDDLPGRFHAYENWLTLGSLATPSISVESDALCSLMYTSGTTGLPKGVMLPHRAWQAVSALVRTHLGYRDGERTLHIAPLTHGSGFLLLPTFEAGGINFLSERFEPIRALALVRDERISNGFFVPAMIRMLIDAQKIDNVDLSSLHTIYYAGSPIDSGTLKQALECFGEDVLVQSFAQMEAPMFLTVLDRADHRAIQSGKNSQLIRSAGRICEGARVQVVDDQGHELPSGEAGEIRAMAPQMMTGYWKRPEESSEAIREGWLHTGDVGKFDNDGYLYVVDRKKDMIISGGSNVYAREVEEVLLSIPGISDAAVIGVPDRKWGEAVTGVLVASGAILPDFREIEAYCREKLPDYRRPKTYHWVQALPRNAYGKVLKRQLREQFAVNMENEQ